MRNMQALATTGSFKMVVASDRGGKQPIAIDLSWVLQWPGWYTVLGWLFIPLLVAVWYLFDDIMCNLVALVLLTPIMAGVALWIMKTEAVKAWGDCRLQLLSL